MTAWSDGEKGPKCKCGWPTIVKVLNDRPNLMCFFHTNAEGAMFRLPSNRPDDWSADLPQERLLEVIVSGEKEFPFEDDDEG